MRWYSILARVPMGQGDYQGDTKCLFDGRLTSDKSAQEWANIALQGSVQKIEIYKGKNLGRFWKEVKK